jgi:branched-chain amino acid aminotransferase
MSNRIWFSGNFQEITQLNYNQLSRAVRFGDGVFETIRMFNNHPLFLGEHYRRMKQGLIVLGISSVQLPSIGAFQEIIAELSKGELSAGRVRIQVFRSGQGFDLPEKNEAEVLVQVFPLPEIEYPQAKVKAHLVEAYKIHPSILTTIKSGNRLPYILAAQEAQKFGAIEGILMNTTGAIAEGNSSNLFAVNSDKQILTPPISEGALPGIMRAQILELLPSWGYSVSERPILAKELPDFQEIWLTNVVQGIRTIETLGLSNGEILSFSLTLGNEVREKLNTWVAQRQG